MTRATANTALGHLKGLQNNTNAKWWKDAGLRSLMFWFACILVSQMTVGYDESLIGSFQAMQPWLDAMGNPDSQDIGLISAILFVGGFATAFIASPLADRYGRRASLATGAFFCLAGAIVQSAAQDRGMFIGGRVLIGMGVAFTTNAGPSLLNELAHPRMRGTIASMFNVLWYVGSIIASWLCFGTGHITTSWSWRIPSIVQGVPALFVLISIPFMPESPRYLYSRGRSDETLGILSKYHANGSPTDPLVTAELAEISAALSLESATEVATWKNTLSSRPNRHRFGICVAVAILVLWTGQSAITYYFSPILTSIGIKSTNQQTGINGGMQIWNLLWSISGAFLADRLGRRTLWLMSFGGMLCANIPLIITNAQYAKTGSKAAAYATVVFLFFYNAGFNIGCNPLPYAYTAEIMPYSIRTRGMSVFIAFANAALTANTYVNPIALDRIGYWMFVFYAGMLVIAIVIVWLWFPETKGRTLEEITGLFGEEIVTEGLEVVKSGQQGLVEEVVVPKGVAKRGEDQV